MQATLAKRGKGNWGRNGGSPHLTPVESETTSYEEDGRTITVCPPGSAAGSTRGVLDDLA